MAQKILILKGGLSSEREVSLVSGSGIAQALKDTNYDIIEYDYKNSFDLIKTIKENNIDVVFNALHGGFGEDGTIPALLDLLETPYTHSGYRASCLAMDKEITKDICKKINIKCAKSIKIKADQINEIDFDFPYVIKPVSEGSSIGVFIIKSEKDLSTVSYDNDMDLMVEEFIEGRELTTSVLDGKALAVTELTTDEKFYDYQAKYTDGLTKHILPADISTDIENLAKEYAIKIHNELECNFISRSDFRYNEKDGLVFLEINTHPGMTPLSLVPEQAEYCGISYKELCINLIKNAKYRKA